MKFERKHAWLLFAITLWMVFTWLMFAKNLSEAYADGEDRPDGYWNAHTMLIVVNLFVAGVLARLGLKIWRATGWVH